MLQIPFLTPSHNKHQVLDDKEDFFLLTWDSCRYDTFATAKTPTLDAFGPARRGYAMGTYTLPAHIAMFNGFLPHVHEDAPLYNRFVQQLWRISHRNLHNKPLVAFPRGTNIVNGLRSRGYFTIGCAAMDWFRDVKALQDGFEAFDYTGTGARAQQKFVTKALSARPNQPCFVFINYGETHSPFVYEGMPNPPKKKDDNTFSAPRLLNQRGIKKDDWTFDELHFRMQVEAAEFLDARIAELLEFIRQRNRPTTIVLCGDHGECFGENGLFGHGFYHEKTMEVPLLIFRVNAPPHEAPQPA